MSEPRSSRRPLTPGTAGEEIAHRLAELQEEVGRLRRETSYASATALHAARLIRVSAKGRYEAEAQAGWERLAPPVGLVRWHPRQSPRDTPDVAQSLIDRLRAGDPVADSMGNSSPYIGQANLLDSPTLEDATWVGVAAPVSPSAAIWCQSWPGGWWKANYTTTGTVQSAAVDSYSERTSSLEHVLATQTIDAMLQPGSTAGTHDLYLWHKPVDLTVAPITAPYLVAAVEVFESALSDWDGITSAKVRLELVQDATSAVVASSDWLDIATLPFSLPRRLEAAALLGDYIGAGDQFYPRLHLQVVSTGFGGEAHFLWGEPIMHFARTPDASPFVPQLGRWVPGAVFHPNEHPGAPLDGNPFIMAKSFDDAYARITVAPSGTVRWGGGGAALDVALRRSGTKTLELDDNAAGPITLKVVGVRQAPPSASQTLAAGTALLANAELVMFTCSGSVTTTAAPTIADGLDGQMLTVLNVGTGTWNIKDQGTLANSNLRLTGTTLAIGPRQSVKLVYSATIGDWVQIGAVVWVL